MTKSFVLLISSLPSSSSTTSLPCSEGCSRDCGEPPFPPPCKRKMCGSKGQEVSGGVGADGFEVKFPMFGRNCSCFPLSRREEKTCKKTKSEEGKIPCTPATPTLLGTSQERCFFGLAFPDLATLQTTVLIAFSGFVSH